jgi:pimeloyl-ACP methyl ester carboxylesterase
LLHGGGQTRDAWGETLAALANAGLLAYTVDLRGHGESDWAPDGVYSIDRQADDLRSIAQVLERPAVYVGASIGGIIAAVAAGEPPGLAARGLVMVDVAPNLRSEGVGAILGFMRNTSSGFETLEQAADAVAGYLPHRPRPADLSGLAKNLRRRGDGKYYWHWDPHTLDYVLDPAEMNARLEQAAAHIDCPALLLRGAESELVTAVAARDFMARFLRGRSVDIAGARHMVAGDRNSMFRDELVRFILSIGEECGRGESTGEIL